MSEIKMSQNKSLVKVKL